MTDEDAREAAAQAIMRSTGPDHPDRDNIFDRQLRTCRHLANLAIDTYASAMPQDDQAARIEALESRQRVLRAFVSTVADQRLSEAAREWYSGEFGDEGEPDFEGAYDSFIEGARRALAGDAG